MSIIYYENKFNVIKYHEDKIPIFLWLSQIEKEAEEQLHHLAALPFAFHHIAAMPDSHVGYGMPIGAVLATKDYIIPHAVGVDIGCGVCCIKTSLFSGSLDQTILKKIMSDIRKLIPVGFKHNNYYQSEELMPNFNRFEDINLSYTKIIVDEEFDSARKQLGTLGGGNHFIEIQKCDDGFLYIMIHSGSRNLGNKVGQYYNKIAIKLNEKWKSQVPKSWQLAFLPFDSKEGKMYFREMQYCVDFAFANRKLMMEKVKEAMSNHCDVSFDENSFINIAHNYAVMENHFGENVLVHRKGATKADKKIFGIIPGSQGTNSYIVKGKENRESRLKASFNSCSHGAGRIMSRSKARKKLNLDDERSKLDNQGIIHSIRSKKDLDEASGAYKDIDEVMDHQKDLVDIVKTLTPLAVIKG